MQQKNKHRHLEREREREKAYQFRQVNNNTKKYNLK